MGNALAESFLKASKRELMEDKGRRMGDEARQDAFKHIAPHYNR